MNNFKSLTEAQSEIIKSRVANRVAELNAFDAFADYYERTGKSAHILGSVEQRKLIEKFVEDQTEGKF